MSINQKYKWMQKNAQWDFGTSKFKMRCSTVCEFKLIEQAQFMPVSIPAPTSLRIAEPCSFFYAINGAAVSAVNFKSVELQ